MANHEGFSDPTAEEAIGRVMQEKEEATPARQEAEAFRRPVVYICSRFAGKDAEEVREHVRQARAYCRFALKKRVVPVAPHLLYPQFLRDDLRHERIIGMFCAETLLTQACSEVWVFVADGLSRGMREELDLALSLKKKIRFFDGTLQEVHVDERAL